MWKTEHPLTDSSLHCDKFNVAVKKGLHLYKRLLQLTVSIHLIMTLLFSREQRHYQAVGYGFCSTRQLFLQHFIAQPICGMPGTLEDTCFFKCSF